MTPSGWWPRSTVAAGQRAWITSARTSPKRRRRAARPMITWRRSSGLLPRNSMQALLLNGVYPAIATHDDRLIEATKRFAREREITPDRFEFQMLYGIRRDLQDRLLREGYRVRIYVPYGTEWYPYLMRRLAERPANLLFIVRSLIRERRAA